MKYLRSKMVIASAITLITGLLAMNIPNAFAASQWEELSWDDGRYITVYQHCGFSGGSKRLTKGDYQRVKDAGIPNNDISSIRIPAGLAVTVYKDTKFRGASKKLKGDVHCLQGKWNDGISSLKVRKSSSAGATSADGWGGVVNPGPRNRGRCVSYNVSASGGEGGFRVTHDPNTFQRIGGRSISGQICGRDRVQVELSKTDRQTGVYLDVGGRQYRFEPGDDGDKLQRSWYRKYYTINVR